MMLRCAGLGLLVGAVLMASSAAFAGPALVFEPYNGTVFYAEDPDAQWFPASLTKLMTAYVTFQALKAGTVAPDTKLICSKEATEQAPSKLWLKVGEPITLDVALKVLIVESANDVAVMIAEGVAGSQEAFVQRMNETAQHLGMRRTNFANVNGLPDERQVTTARDLAKLVRAIIIGFPEHADLFTTVQVQVGKQIMRTHNGLLVNLSGADGMKTVRFIGRLRIQRGGERHPRRPKAGRRGAGRAIESYAPRACDRSLGERLQALFLEVAVRHQHRWAGDPTSLVDRGAAAFEGRHLRRRQTEAVRYAQGQSQGRLEEAPHCQHRRMGHSVGSLADIDEGVPAACPLAAPVPKADMLIVGINVC